MVARVVNGWGMAKARMKGGDDWNDVNERVEYHFSEQIYEKTMRIVMKAEELERLKSL